MRSPADMSIIQLDVTNACKLRCSNCTRLVAHQKQPFVMSLEQFEAAVRSMEGWYQPGRVLGCMGGEPTLHPRFEELSRRFAELWPPTAKPLATNGRQPVKDFNGYVMERLADRSSGRGLWTSLGDKYYEHYETIQEVYDHQCVNTHENPGLHQALLVSRKEMGIDDETWVELRDKCWVQNTWSASITPHGAYFCEVAGAIDNLFYQGKHAWPVEPGWWKRKPSEFGEQLSLCEHCALACPGPSAVAQHDTDIVGKTTLPLLEAVGSPAVKKGCFTPYETNMDAPKLEERPDRYMPAPDMRVAPNHQGVLPRKISCIVTCVGRGEHLERTLPFNAKLVDEIIVVGHKGDSRTWDLDGEVGGVRFVSGDWTVGEAAFNKGSMLNSGLKMLKDPDWILFTDADVFLPPNLPAYVKSHALNPGVLYGARREGDELVGNEPNGFFQLWNRRALALRDRGIAPMSENFCSAGGIDSWFMQQFPPDKRVMIPELSVKHIPHGDFGSGWNGPPRAGCWRQWGMLTAQGFIETEKADPKKLRLTDTLRGRTAEVQTGKVLGEIIRRGPNGIIFLGEDIGQHHVHVAYWSEA